MSRDSGDIGTSSAGRRPDLDRRRGKELVIGRLVAHGRAHYQFRSEEDPSYYLKILTSSGPRTLWGKDLDRALRDAETQPKAGDLIGARRRAREAVTVTSRHRDDKGHVVSTSERITHRSLWVVEKVTYFAERARLARQVREDQVDAKATVKRHPELLSSFLSVRAAEEFAKNRIPSVEDRQRFLELIRGVLSASIHEGTPLPNVRLKDRGAPVKLMPLSKRRDDPTR
jgi:hypothetical protein